MNYNLDKVKDIIIEACKNSSSMLEARSKTGLTFATFKRYALKLGVYNPTQNAKSSANMKKLNAKRRFKTEDILNGKHPGYQSGKLKKRLFEENIKKAKCEDCGGDKWLGKPMPLELEHIDGDKNNNELENLKILCPNCHTFTSTYKSKNIKKKLL